MLECPQLKRKPRGRYDPDAETTGYIRVCVEGMRSDFSELMPRDWRSLFLFWARGAVRRTRDIEVWDRDAALCPKHASELQGLLKRIK